MPQLSPVRGGDGLRNHDADFHNGEKLTDHFDRHGSDFRAVNQNNYLNKANSFFGNPPSKSQSFTHGAGTYFQYNPVYTFEIINQCGGFLTFYKISLAMDYWLDQISKYKPK